MKKLLFIFIILIVALFSVVVFSQNPVTPECKNIEGSIFIMNGWPPHIRIESIDKKDLFGMETDEEEIPLSGYMPESLWQKLMSEYSLSGTFCIELTGGKTKVPYDDRVIKYVKVISYKLNDSPKEP
jgi:hypothetical protein